MTSSVMANTIIMDEKVVVDYSKNYKNNIKIGDVIVYKYRDINSSSRCIALENDKIEIIDNNVFINDIMINEPYKNLDQEQFERVKNSNPFDEINYDLSETIIDKNHVFILADNRYNGTDSRFIGQLSRYAIIGKVLYIYSSKNRDRIGKKIE
jgi:signal peptidase I